MRGEEKKRCFGKEEGGIVCNKKDINSNEGILGDGRKLTQTGQEQK